MKPPPMPPPITIPRLTFNRDASLLLGGGQGGGGLGRGGEGEGEGDGGGLGQAVPSAVPDAEYDVPTLPTLTRSPHSPALVCTTL
jgi:hypothetical protein